MRESGTHTVGAVVARESRCGSRSCCSERAQTVGLAKRVTVSARGTLPWARPRHELLLLALVAIVALTPVAGVDAQDQSRLCFSEALLHGHLANDACLAGSVDFSRFNGHLYSDKAPGLSLLAVPAVAVLRPGPRSGVVE